MRFNSEAYDELFPRQEVKEETHNEDSMLNDFRKETKEKVGEEDGISGTDESNTE